MATDEKSFGFSTFLGTTFAKRKGKKKGTYFGGGATFNLVLCFLGAKRRESRPPKNTQIGYLLKATPTDCKTLKTLNPKPSKFWFFAFQEKEIT
jgi:hypothetical protein